MTAAFTIFIKCAILIKRAMLVKRTSVIATAYVGCPTTVTTVSKVRRPIAIATVRLVVTVLIWFPATTITTLSKVRRPMAIATVTAAFILVFSNPIFIIVIVSVFATATAAT
jgi:hypothetical protein